MPDGAFQNTLGIAIPVVARDPPPEGQRVVPLAGTIDGDNFNGQNLTFQLGAQSMSQVRTLFVDNTENTQPLSITHGAALQTTQVPAGGGAFIPTTSNQGNYIFFFSIGGAPVVDTPVEFALYNYEIPPAVWGTTIITVGGDSLPIGFIGFWYSTFATIPSGWGLCDGSAYVRSDGGGTIVSPNLVDQFVLGANAGNQGVTGGSFFISQANLPNVNFVLTITINDPGHQHILATNSIVGSQKIITETSGGVIPDPAIPANELTANSAQNAVTSISASGTAASGGSGSAYFPPFIALCAIMKI